MPVTVTVKPLRAVSRASIHTRPRRGGRSVHLPTIADHVMAAVPVGDQSRANIDRLHGRDLPAGIDRNLAGREESFQAIQNSHAYCTSSASACVNARRSGCTPVTRYNRPRVEAVAHGDVERLAADDQHRGASPRGRGLRRRQAAFGVHPDGLGGQRRLAAAKVTL